MARRRKKAEIWIGLLAIVSAVVLFWGYFWLTGQPLGERGYTLTVILEDAGGLEKGDRVHMRGVEVGVVRSVELVTADRIVVRLWLHRDLELPRDTRALLQAVGVFGDVIMVLEPGTSDVLASAGDTLSVGRAPSLMDLAGDLGEQADALLRKIDRLLADSTIDQLHGGVAGLPGTIRGLEELVTESGAEFAALSQSLRETAETIQGKLEGADIDRIVADLEALAATAAETAEELKVTAASLRSVADKIDRGEGTLGLLVNDPGLYEDLRAATQNVASLTQDIQQNPGRYIKLSIF